MIGPALAKDGYCAFRLAYGRYKGNYGYGPIAASADQLARFVKHLLRQPELARWPSLLTPKAAW